MSVKANADTVLIVSTGRTGTRFLANYLNTNCADVEAHHITDNSTLINVLSNVQLSGLMPEVALLWAWKLLKGSTFGISEKRVYVDSNNHLYAFARLAGRLYPGVRVVHVVRDPRTYVRSHINWSRQRLKSYVANNLIPFWQPNGWLMGEVSARTWFAMNLFERFCWVWDFKNRLMANLEDTGLRYFRVRFEDFTVPQTAPASLRALLDFLGLEPCHGQGHRPQTKAVNQSTTNSFPEWQHWNAEQRQTLQRLCGEQMRKYGYGTEPEWLKHVP